MPTEPTVKRVIAFFDGQTLVYAVKKAFGYRWPNYDPVALAQAVCGSRGWNLLEDVLSLAPLSSIALLPLHRPRAGGRVVWRLQRHHARLPLHRPCAGDRDVWPLQGRQATVHGVHLQVSENQLGLLANNLASNYTGAKPISRAAAT